MFPKLPCFGYTNILHMVSNHFKFVQENKTYVEKTHPFPHYKKNQQQTRRNWCIIKQEVCKECVCTLIQACGPSLPSFQVNCFYREMNFMT